MSKKHGSKGKSHKLPGQAPKPIAAAAKEEPTKAAVAANTENILNWHRSQEVSRPITSVADDTTESEFPEYTQAPGTNLPVYVLALDSTHAPAPGHAETVEGDFAQNPSALADKYFLSQLRPQTLVFLTPLVPIIWIFIQDNGAGRLQTSAGVFSCLTKCGIILLMCFVVLALAVLATSARKAADE